MLMSFAEFEREMIGERTRDKMVAARRKGKWMGGFVPLSYDIANKQLVVNELEALVVREVFELYAEASLGVVGGTTPQRDAVGRPSATCHSDGKVRPGRAVEQETRVLNACFATPSTPATCPAIPSCTRATTRVSLTVTAGTRFRAGSMHAARQGGAHATRPMCCAEFCAAVCAERQ